MYMQGSLEQEEFIRALIADIALSLGVDPSEISISGLQLARRRRAQAFRRTQSMQDITFEVTIYSSNASTALTSLVTQIADPTSPLMNTATAGNINPEVTPHFAFVCPIGMMRGSEDTGE